MVESYSRYDKILMSQWVVFRRWQANMIKMMRIGLKHLMIILWSAYLQVWIRFLKKMDFRLKL